jgi:hypothetical protein
MDLNVRFVIELIMNLALKIIAFLTFQLTKRLHVKPVNVKNKYLGIFIITKYIFKTLSN